MKHFLQQGQSHLPWRGSPFKGANARGKWYPRQGLPNMQTIPERGRKVLLKSVEQNWYTFSAYLTFSLRHNFDFSTNKCPSPPQPNQLLPWLTVAWSCLWVISFNRHRATSHWPVNVLAHVSHVIHMEICPPHTPWFSWECRVVSCVSDVFLQLTALRA